MPVKAKQDSDSKTTEYSVDSKAKTLTINATPLPFAVFHKTQPGMTTLVGILRGNGIDDVGTIKAIADKVYNDESWVADTLGKVDSQAKNLVVQAIKAKLDTSLAAFNQSNKDTIAAIVADIQARDALADKIKDAIVTLKEKAIQDVDSNLDPMFDLVFLPSTPGFMADTVKDTDSTRTHEKREYDYLAKDLTYPIKAKDGYQGLDSDHRYKATLLAGKTATKDGDSTDGKGWVAKLVMTADNKVIKSDALPTANQAFKDAIAKAREVYGIEPSSKEKASDRGYQVSIPQVFGVPYTVIPEDDSTDSDSTDSDSTDSDSTE